MPGFDAYDAAPSMFELHKFMNLTFAENTYFITQVGLAAASFGVAEEDIAIVAGALNSLFNVRCAPPTTVIPDDGDQLHSICIDEETCPLAENATCVDYCEDSQDDDEEAECTSAPVPPPGGNSTATPTDGMPTQTGSEPSPTPTGAAGLNTIAFGAVAAGIAAFLL